MRDLSPWKRKPVLWSLAVLLCIAGATAMVAQDPPPPEHKGTYYDKFGGHGHGHGHGHAQSHGHGHGHAQSHGHGHGHGHAVGHGHGHGHGSGRSAPLPPVQPVDLEKVPRVTWTNPQGGSFHDAGSWSGGAVPGAEDHAVIDLAGTYSVTLDQETRLTALSLGAESGAQTLVLPTEALAVAGPATIGPSAVLELAGGRITGDGDLVVLGEVQWSGGAISGRGKVRIEAGSRFSLTGDERKVLSVRHVENAGTLVWSGAGNLVVTFDAQILNQQGARFDIATGALLDVYGPPGPSVQNAGTLRVVADFKPTFETPLVNTGTLDLEAGGLHLLAGYSGEGTVMGREKLEVSTPEEDAAIAAQAGTDGG